MSFRNFVQDMQNLMTAEQIDATEMGTPEDSSSPEEPTTTAPESELSQITETLITEMAIATALGAKLTRIKDEKFKDYDLSGYHNISIDGEHIGVMGKRTGKANSFRRGGNHYVVKPTLDGHFNSGSWKPLTASELGKHYASPDDSGMYVQTHHQTGELTRYTNDTTDADHKFPGHDTGDRTFETQQHALDHVTNAHRMAKEFPGETGQADRWNAAVDVKERYLQNTAASRKAYSIRSSLSSAMSSAKQHYPGDTDLHAAIGAALEHSALGPEKFHDGITRFRNLTHDLPTHSWSSTEADPHANIRSIDTPWKT